MSLKYFKREEFDCQVTGTNNMEQEFLEKLDKLREACGLGVWVSHAGNVGLPSSNQAPHRNEESGAGNTRPRDCG
jgi:hypothetical protein